MLRVGEPILAQTFGDLAACLPQEGVGLWSGHGLHVQSWTPLQNVSLQPQTRYEVSPAAWIAAWQQITERGETPMALVHSHPTAAPVPSTNDRKHWHYPKLWCVIVSFAEAEPRWQAYQLETGIR